MEAVSAAASIIGVITVSAKLISILRSFSASVTDAPRLVQGVCSEISGLSACLHQIQSLMNNMASVPKSKAALLMVDQVQISLAECVIVISELDRAIDSVKSSTGVIEVVKWLWKEDVIEALLSRLQAVKLTLHMMLATLTWLDML